MGGGCQSSAPMPMNTRNRGMMPTAPQTNQDTVMLSEPNRGMMPTAPQTNQDTVMLSEPRHSDAQMIPASQQTQTEHVLAEDLNPTVARMVEGGIENPTVAPRIERQQRQSPSIIDRQQIYTQGYTWGEPNLIPKSTKQADELRQHLRVANAPGSSFLNMFGSDHLKAQVQKAGKRSSEIMRATLNMLEAGVEEMTIEVSPKNSLLFGKSDSVKDIKEQVDNVILISGENTVEAITQHMMAKAAGGVKCLIMYPGGMFDGDVVRNELLSKFQKANTPHVELNTQRLFNCLTQNIAAFSMYWGEIETVNQYFNMERISSTSDDHMMFKGEPCHTLINHIDIVLWLHVDEIGSRTTEVESVQNIAGCLGKFKLQQNIFLLHEESVTPDWIAGTMMGARRKEEWVTQRLNCAKLARAEEEKTNDNIAATPRTLDTSASNVSRCSLRSYASNRTEDRHKRMKNLTGAISDAKIAARVGHYAPLMLVKHASYYVWVADWSKGSDQGSFVLGRCEATLPQGSGFFSYFEPKTVHGGPLLRRMVELGNNSWRVRNVLMSPEWLVDGYIRSYVLERDELEYKRTGSGPRLETSIRLLDIFLMSKLMDGSPHNEFRDYHEVTGQKVFYTYPYTNAETGEDMVAWKMVWQSIREEFHRIFPTSYTQMMWKLSAKHDHTLSEAELEKKLQQKFRQRARVLRKTRLGEVNIGTYQDTWREPVDYDNVNLLS